MILNIPGNIKVLWKTINRNGLKEQVET